MSKLLTQALIMALMPLVTVYANEELTEALSDELITNQDTLSAEIQELIELQTQEGVVQKLEETEGSMIEATLRLLEGDTSDATIAIQTEIIEKAYEAAKEKQKSQSSSSDTVQALMDSIEKMLGKESQQPSKSSDKKEKDKSSGGSGQEGDGNGADRKPNDITYESPSTSTRTVPSASPTTGQLLPPEFQELIDDYNAR